VESILCQIFICDTRSRRRQ